jgi:hypothetical protein
MNNSVSRFAAGSTPGALENTLAGQAPSAILRRAWRNGAAGELRGIPVDPAPLLAIQRMSFQATSVMCVCADARAAQRYFCEATNAISQRDQRAFLLHELMPPYQAEFTLECLKRGVEAKQGSPNLVVITTAWYRRLVATADPLLHAYKVIDVRDPEEESARGQGGREEDEPTVSCICLRKGPGGRWLLMDHDDAAVVSAGVTPSAEVAMRLLRHAVPISGRQLAPYLAMMFDVPHAWKSNGDLAACALLIFDNDECVTGCSLPGIPSKLIWNDVLGIVCGG